jgi:hypothetical protein
LNQEPIVAQKKFTMTERDATAGELLVAAEPADGVKAMKTRTRKRTWRVIFIFILKLYHGMGGLRFSK